MQAMTTLISLKTTVVYHCNASDDDFNISKDNCSLHYNGKLQLSIEILKSTSLALKQIELCTNYDFVLLNGNIDVKG
jgi:hypothetical protein